MSTRLSLRIQERITRLTKSEQKLAQVILEAPTIIETHTATELARISGVSKATTARFFRALGYSDFDEVKLQAREERNRTQPFSYTETDEGGRVLGRSIGDHLELELTNITRTFEELSSDLLREAAKVVSEAPRVWFLGLGADIWLARYGRLTFSRLRHNVDVLSAAEGALAEDLAMMGPRDVLIVMAQGPQRKELGAILSYARTTRASVIMIADHGNLALAKRYSDLAIPCHIASYGLVDTHTTVVSLLRLLAIALAGYIGEPAMQRASLIKDVAEELEDLE